jgi:serine/threonine protein kinase
MDCEVLVFECFAGRALQKLTSKLHKLSEEKARGIFLALLSAVAYLHEKNIIHRDIKADNVLVSQDLSDLRLIDFNTSRRLNQGETPLTMTGTYTWSAPEVLLGDCPGKPNDVWGMGLCLHYMLIGELPWSRDDLEMNAFAAKLLRYVDGLKQSSIQALSKECMTTLQCCLEADQTMRAQADSLLRSNPFGTAMLVAVAA